MDLKTLIIAQIIMTCMMACSMSGIMLYIAIGPVEDFLSQWGKQIIIAWPIAFVLTQGVSRVAFPLAGKIRARFA